MDSNDEEDSLERQSNDIECSSNEPSNEALTATNSERVIYKPSPLNMAFSQATQYLHYFQPQFGPTQPLSPETLLRIDSFQKSLLSNLPSTLLAVSSRYSDNSFTATNNINQLSNKLNSCLASTSSLNKGHISVSHSPSVPLTTVAATTTITTTTFNTNNKTIDLTKLNNRTTTINNNNSHNNNNNNNSSIVLSSSSPSLNSTPSLSPVLYTVSTKANNN